MCAQARVEVAGDDGRRDRARAAGAGLRRAGRHEAQADKLVAKLLKLRIFGDAAGKMNRSLQDVAGGLLVVSQFTLAADVSGGNRPSFTGAAPAALGARALRRACCAWRASGTRRCSAGEFGADMQVHLVNDGPVTIPPRFALKRAVRRHGLSSVA